VLVMHLVLCEVMFLFSHTHTQCVRCMISSSLVSNMAWHEFVRNKLLCSKCYCSIICLYTLELLFALTVVPVK
jgi:hypothetical protein